MDIRETAAVLRISEASVKVRLHRARALLQRHLAPQLRGFAPKGKAGSGDAHENRLQTRLGTHLGVYRERRGPDLRADIDRHLETCEICSAVLDSTRNVVILMADERVFELPAGFSERLHARIERELEHRRLRRPRFIAVPRDSAGWRRSLAVNHGVRPGFQPDENQGNDRQNDL